MTKKVLISLEELNALCKGYKDDYIRHNLTTAENNLELWFFGNEVVEDDEVVEYALSRTLSPALIAEYQTQLPDKKMLREKLHEFYLQNAPEEEGEL